MTSQTFQIRQLLQTATQDADAARAAVRDAEQALSAADVALALGTGTQEALDVAEQALSDARAVADRHIRRRAALVQAETESLDADRKAAYATQSAMSQAVREQLAPRMEELGAEFMRIAVDYAAHVSLVRNVPSSLIDVGRLLAQQCIEKPVNHFITIRIGELSESLKVDA